MVHRPDDAAHFALNPDAMPEVRDKLAEQGIDVAGSTADALAATVKTEIAKWAKVIKDGNIKPE